MKGCVKRDAWGRDMIPLKGLPDNVIGYICT